jgi:hypothetical protein
MLDRTNQHDDQSASSLHLHEEQQIAHPTHLIHAGIGGTAGLLMESLLHPIDTVRTRIKANAKEAISLFTQIKTMHRTEGPKSYFRGFTCTLPGSFVGNATYFFVYEKLKNIFSSNHILSTDTAPFLAAFLGGLASNALFLPFEVVRTRMQLKPGHYDYRHFWDGARKVLKHEGFRKLYLGASVFFTLTALETSLTFGFYEIFKKTLEPFFPSHLEFNLPLCVTCSVSAAAMAGFIVNPLEVLVTRVQTSNTKVQGAITVPAMVRKIYQNEGLGGFMKGVSGTVSYYAMGALLLFPTYEILKGVSHVDLSH